MDHVDLNHSGYIRGYIYHYRFLVIIPQFANNYETAKYWVINGNVSKKISVASADKHKHGGYYTTKLIFIG